MTWFVFYSGRRVAVVPGVVVRVGRGSECDLVIDERRISRVHLEILVDESGICQIQDTSSNGTFQLDGEVSTASISQTTCLALGGTDGPVVVVSDDPALDWAEELTNFQVVLDEAAGSAVVDGAASIMSLDGVTRMGRAKDNDVVLDGALASAYHAHLRRDGGHLEVIDLASERGTFVNGTRVSRAELREGDQLTMGGSVFAVTADGSLITQANNSGLSLEAKNLTVQIGAATLLDDVSFVLPARKVLAVVGPSGSGKSTLLGGLTGFTPATQGRVLVGGRDLYAEYDDLRFQVGLVPQSDLVPAQLRVQDALEYAARLRFPRDTSAQDRATRVEEVLSDLSLTPRAGLRINRLSGGQRKRVSVALEMLTKPALLFLDEPTSGLDPGLDKQVMVLLRELADAGRTIVVVTHSVENLALADYLLVLAAGGHVAYFGPPENALEYFNVPDMPSVFLALEGTPGPQWAKRWNATKRSTGTQDVSDAARSGTPATATEQAAKPRVSRPRGSLSQFLTLTSRNIKVIAADRTYSALLLILPLVLAATGILVGSAAGLGSSDDPPFLNPESRLLLMVLVLGSVFTGAATSIQELVKDRVIYQRERAVGLSRFAYISSKALVLGVISALQGLVFALLSLVGRPGPDDPLVLPGTLEIAVIVSAATVASCMLGLILSGLLSSRDAALPALVIATMVQVVFSGSIPLRFDKLLDYVGWAMPAYWEFKAMAASIGLDNLLGNPGEPTWPHETGEWWLSLGVLAAMTFIFVGFAIWVAGRHDPGRKRK